MVVLLRVVGDLHSAERREHFNVHKPKPVLRNLRLRESARQCEREQDSVRECEVEPCRPMSALVCTGLHRPALVCSGQHWSAWVAKPSTPSQAARDNGDLEVSEDGQQIRRSPFHFSQRLKDNLIHCFTRDHSKYFQPASSWGGPNESSDAEEATAVCAHGL